MTISVSANGEYAEAEGMWVSHNGEWIEVSGGGGGLAAMELTLVGTPLAGNLQLRYKTPDGSPIPLGVTATLYAKHWADRRVVPGSELTVQAVPSGETEAILSYSPAALDEVYQTKVTPFTGWAAAVYWVEVDGYPAGSFISNQLVVLGEAALRLVDQVAGGNEVSFTVSTLNVYFLNPLDPATNPNSSIWNLPGWLGTMTYGSVNAPIYDFTELQTHVMWEVGDFEYSMTKTVNGTTTKLFQVDAPFALDTPYPPETFLKAFEHNGLYTNVDFDWRSVEGKQLSARRSDTPQIPSGTFEQSGLTNVYLIAYGTTYTPSGSGVLSVSGDKILCTAPPGTPISLIWEAPYLNKGAVVPEHRTTKLKYTDANGQAFFAQEDFTMNDVCWTAGNNMGVAPPGKYIIRDGLSAPIYKSGQIRTRATGPNYYWRCYFNTYMVAEYVYNNGEQHNFQGLEYDTYGYTYGQLTLGVPTLVEGWTNGSAGDELGFVSAASTLNIWVSQVPTDSAVMSETLLWTSSGYTPGTLGVAPWFSQLDDPNNFVSGGSRGVNPPINNAAAWGPNCFTDLFRMVDVVHA